LVAGLLFLAFAVFLMQFSSSLPSLYPTPIPKVELDPLSCEGHAPDVRSPVGSGTPQCKVNTPNLKLSGRYLPFKTLEVMVNARSQEVFTSADGRFQTTVSLARRSNQISVAPLPALDAGGSEISKPATVSVTYSVNPVQPPEIQVVVDSSPDKKLLVGTADPYLGVLLTDDANKIETPTVSDDTGIFVLEVPSAVVQNPEKYRLGAGEFRLGEKTPWMSLQTALAKTITGSLSRSVTFAFEEDAVHVEFRLQGPLQLPHVERLIKGELSRNEFIRTTFGYVSPFTISEMPLQLSVVTKETGQADVKLVGSLPYAEGGRRELMVEMQGADRKYGVPLSDFGLEASATSLGHWPLLTGQDTFTVRFHDLQPAWLEPIPTHMDAEQAVWKGPLPGVRAVMEVPKGTPKTLPAPEEKEPLTVRQALDSLTLPPLTHALGEAIIFSIPFVWVLALLRTNQRFLARNEGDQWHGRSRTAAECLVLWALSMWYVVYLLSSTMYANISRVIPSGWNWRLSDSGIAFLALYLSSLAIVRPFTSSLERNAEGWLGWSATRSLPETSPWKHRWSWICGTGLIVMGIGFLWKGIPILEVLAKHGYNTKPLLAFMEHYGLTLWVLALSLIVTWLVGWRFGAVFAVLCSCGIALVSLILPTSSGGGFLNPGRLQDAGLLVTMQLIKRVGHAWSVVLLYLLLLFVVSYLIRQLIPPRVLSRAARFLFIISLAVAIPTLSLLPARRVAQLGGWLLVAVAAWLISYAAGVSSRFRAWRDRYRVRPATLWLLGAGLVVFLIVPVGSRPVWEGFFPLLQEFVNVWKYIPFIIILMWLQTRDQKLPQSDDLPLAYFLFSVYLVGYSETWFYVPLPLIIGYILAKFWLLRPIEGLAVDETARSSTRERLKELIQRRWAERMMRSFEKSQDKKLGAGDFGPDEYRQKLAAFQRALAPEETGNRSTPQSIQEMALAYGPTGDSWQNGVIAVQYGLPLALIPAALTMYEFVAGRAQALFPALTFSLRMVFSFSYWLALAFFFGYFYTFIRGKTGLTKGAFLALGVTLPYLCYSLIQTQSLAEFRYFFLWATEVFSFCTLLGLFAFDYETLRRNGYSLRDVFSLHNTPTLSAFASSLVAALVPGIMAIMSGKALDLAKSLADRILPHVQP
jgi:hypothetical protein